MLTYISIAMLIVAILYPLLFIVSSAIKTNDEIYSNPFGFASDPNWAVFERILIHDEFYRNIFNSVYYAVTTTALSAIVCFLAAYAITRMKWKLRFGFLAMLLTGILVPNNAVVLPLFVLTRRIGFSDPRITLVLVFTAFSLPRTVFILAGFLRDLPRSLEEAAVIDGCNIWQAMAYIVAPVVKPAIATVSIFNFLLVWNDLLLSLVFIREIDGMTVQVGLRRFQGLYETDYPTLLAAVTLVIVPIMVAYVFLQKNIITGMTAGASKG